jgi:hypothetical protein
MSLLCGTWDLAAVPLTIWGVETLKSFVPADIPRLNDAGLSLAVVGFLVAVALVTAALFSLAPSQQPLRSQRSCSSASHLH